MHDPRTVLITGASSGLGAALARAYAQPGVALALTGRDPARLATVAADCAARGARTVTASFDVVDSDRLRDWIGEIDRQSPLDLVIANAGVSAQTSGRGETAAQTRRIFAINVDGVINTVEPVLAPMIARGRGQIAIMSSLASFRSFPGTAAYCASKAAIRLWGEGLRVELAPKGVAVSVICPGFVRTPLTDTNDFPMPFLMEPEPAARLIVARLARNRGRIAFPWPMYVGARLLAALPPAVGDFLAARAREKANRYGGAAR